LHPELCPHTFKGQNKESLQQEKNLQYVALTRSKRTLILACSGGVKKPQSKKTDDCPKDCQKSKEEELDS
jgi:ATP-dependent exoDNAse (exonuclease V) beta subunit